MFVDQLDQQNNQSDVGLLTDHDVYVLISHTHTHTRLLHLILAPSQPSPANPYPFASLIRLWAQVCSIVIPFPSLAVTAFWFLNNLCSFLVYTGFCVGLGTNTRCRIPWGACRCAAVHPIFPSLRMFISHTNFITRRKSARV